MRAKLSILSKWCGPNPAKDNYTTNLNLSVPFPLGYIQYPWRGTYYVTSR